MSARVLVVGGGYGGITAAAALDDIAEVTLIEPRDAFVHNVAALRALVDAEWAERIFVPYDRLLPRGRVVADRAVKVEPGAVTVASGERLTADYIVLATGSGYPFPAKFDVEDRASALARLAGARTALDRASQVLLLGAGPVGLELAGEIAARWPAHDITIVDPAKDILPGGLPDELRTELRGQLDALGVELALGAPLDAPPPTEPGTTGRFTVTAGGREVGADIWFRCHGVVPASDYLTGELAGARRADGYIDVNAELRLPGQSTVFAIGDVAGVTEPKMAKSAGDHAETVVGTIRALITGDPAPARTYTPGEPGIALPLGPAGGASYTPEVGLLGAEQTAQLKGETLMVDRFAGQLGY